jgi:excisionase family DNA binding protein
MAKVLPFITLEQLADMVGKSRQTTTKLVRQGRLPQPMKAHENAAQYWFDRQEVEEFLEASQLVAGGRRR